MLVTAGGRGDAYRVKVPAAVRGEELRFGEGGSAGGRVVGDGEGVDLGHQYSCGGWGGLELSGTGDGRGWAWGHDGETVSVIRAAAGD